MATPLAVNTNGGSLTAQRNLSGSHKALQTSIQRLSSGLRIFLSGGQRHAGMAISENMRAQQGGFRQAQRNANDGVSVLQTAESGYQSISDLLVCESWLFSQPTTASLTPSEATSTRSIRT